MLEGLAAWVLNTYLGKYLENLNTDQLSIGLLKGQVELENVPLKKDALLDLGLPIEIKAGCVGRIKLEIPVRHLRSEPWVVSLEKLYVVVGPIRYSNRNMENEKLKMQKRKMEQLDILEAEWRAKHCTKTENAQSWWLSGGTSLAANIIENLQLKIIDVHIRYEDSLPNMSESFAWGITLQSLSAQSTDSEWVPNFSSGDSSEIIRKLIEMQYFAVYWESTTTFIGDLPLAILVNMMQLQEHPDPIHRETESFFHFREYIIKPVYASARLHQLCSKLPLRSRTTPRFVCDLQLEKFSIDINKLQYKQFLTWVLHFGQQRKLSKFKKWRPVQSVKANAREWWQFAIYCQLEEIKNRRKYQNWPFIIQRARAICLYVTTYTKYLINPNSLSDNVKKQKDAIEQELNLSELIFLREIAMEKVHNSKEEKARKQTEKVNQTNVQGLLQRWFPLWSGWYSTNVSTDKRHVDEEDTPKIINEEASLQIAKSQELEKEILDALKDTMENNTIPKQDTVFAKINFALGSMTFSLATAIKSKLLDLEFSEVEINFESRPHTSSLLFQLRVGSLYLYDKITPGSIFPRLLSPHSKDSTYSSKSTYMKLATLTGLAHVQNAKPDDEQLFALLYEKNPFSKTTDHRLEVKAKSLDVVFNAAAFQCFMEFFIHPYQKESSTTSSFPELNFSTVAKKSYKQLKTHTNNVESDETATELWDIYLDISAPHIIIPENLTAHNTILVIVDFGRLRFANSSMENQINPGAGVGIAKSKEEGFHTPCASPPDEPLFGSQPLLPQFQGIIKEDVTIHQRIYDRYALELCNLQVLVAQMNDNWRFAHLKGNGHMHVVDSFDITMQLERRTFNTTDPHWPNFRMAGSIPQLMVHISEHKLQSLRDCVSLVCTFPLQYSKSLQNTTTSPQRVGDQMPGYEVQKSTPLSIRNESIQSQNVKLEISEGNLKEESLSIQFCIQHLSVELQSRGQNVAELQVGGIKLMATKLPFTLTLGLTIHTLLLVDANQTLGPEYELLVASSKMDIKKDNFAEDKDALSSLSSDSTELRSVSDINGSVPGKTECDTDLPFSPAASFQSETNPCPPFVISVDIVIITPQCQSASICSEILRIVTIQFNHLEITANQETVNELFHIFKLLLPGAAEPTTNSSLCSNWFDSSEETSKSNTRTEIVFVLHHLSMLLLRVIKKDNQSFVKEIALAAIGGLWIKATLGISFKVLGSLESFHIRDLTPNCVYKQIVSVGCDGNNKELRNFNHPTPFTSFMRIEGNEKTDAFTFKIRQEDYLEITVHLASFCYVHSVYFLQDFTQYISELTTSLSKLSASVRNVAKEEFVVHGTGILSGPICKSFSQMEISGEVNDSMKRTTSTINQYAQQYEENVQVRIDILLETSLVIVPRTYDSKEVIVVQLGKATIENMQNVDGQHFEENTKLPKTYLPTLGRVNIIMQDVNLFSDTLICAQEHKDSKSKNSDFIPAQCFHCVYNKPSCAHPIVHNAVIELAVDCLVNQPTPHHGMISLNNGHLLEIVGTVVSPLKISFCRRQYIQLIDTIDSLTLNTSGTYEVGTSFGLERKASQEPLFTNVTHQMDESLQPQTMQFFNSLIGVNGSFEVPLITVHLTGKLNNDEQELVNFSFEDLKFDLKCKESLVSAFQISLNGFIMKEELQKSQPSRVIATLKPVEVELPSCGLKSLPSTTSCTDIRSCLKHQLPIRKYVTGLKKHKGIFDGSLARARQRRNSKYHPPPSSPSTHAERGRVRSLLRIKFVFVHPQFSECHKCPDSMQYKIATNINQAVAVINLQAWLTLLEYFTNNVNQYQGNSLVPQEFGGDLDNLITESTDANVLCYDVDFQVCSLTLALNKEEYEITRITFNHVVSQAISKKECLSINGKLGGILVKDSSPFAGQYAERFTTSGDEAMELYFFRFTSSDPELTRLYDMNLKLNVSSVRYIHTQRFYDELWVLHQQFCQFLYIGSRIYESPSLKVNQGIKHPPRLQLNIQVNNPVIFLPESVSASNLVVVEFERLSVTNNFLLTRCEEQSDPTETGVLKSEFLLDVWKIALTDINLYSASRLCHDAALEESTGHEFKFISFSINCQEKPLLKEKFYVSLQMEINLVSSWNHCVPDVRVQGFISPIHCLLDIYQYKIFYGLLEYNLGESAGPYSSYQSTSFAQPLIPPIANMTVVWICKKVDIELGKLTLELLHFEQKCRSGIGLSLAKIGVISCQYRYEIYSNAITETELKLKEFLIFDTRFKGNPKDNRIEMFTKILQPGPKVSCSNPFQVQCYYKSTGASTSFTLKLNHMRCMIIFDWLMDVWTFVALEAIETPRGHTMMRFNAASQNSPQTTKVASAIVPGIVTKRVSLSDQDWIPLEMSIITTVTELIVIEDVTSLESNAIILRGSSRICCRQSLLVEKPLYCNIEDLEVFSCLLNAEEDTALSIIDPFSFTIEMYGNIKPRAKGGLLEAINDSLFNNVQISAHHLIVQLSYKDMQLIMKILKSIPLPSNDGSLSHADDGGATGNRTEELMKNENLKFHEVGHTDEYPASYDGSNSQVDETSLVNKHFALGSVEVHIETITCCLIDDCKDADVPLLEVTLSDLNLQVSAGARMEGSATVVISSDYYNRNLSGWEPCLEPCRIQILWWWISSITTQGKLYLKVKGDDVININITSGLIDLYLKVKTVWTEDFYNTTEFFKHSSNRSEHVKKFERLSSYRRGIPFIPFILKNATGCSMKFSTTTINARLREFGSEMTGINDSQCCWTDVAPGETAHFGFQECGKLRHRDSHEMKIHLLTVHVGGWQQVSPVSVDKVGVFFRNANPEDNTIPPTRIVFAITLEGCARKLVTVRSALLLCNKLESVLNVKLENADPITVQLLPGNTWAVPMMYNWATLRVWPASGQWLPCTEPLHWSHVVQPNGTSKEMRLCKSCLPSRKDYRFSVFVRHDFDYDSLPIQRDAQGSESTPRREQEMFAKPGHTIFLLPPVTIENLLPCDVHFQILGMTEMKVLKPGLTTSLHDVDPRIGFVLKFALEIYEECDPVVIQPDCTKYLLDFLLFDSLKRTLALKVRVLFFLGIMKLQVFTPFWFVNHSGLPLIFRQHEAQKDSAGQYPEHEMMQSAVPLLFSFSDLKAPSMCIMRIGTSVQRDGHHHWCQPFSLEKGVSVRCVRISPFDSRSDWTYTIGIHVRVGRGRYEGTLVVTFSPRYLLANETKNGLQFAQKCSAFLDAPTCSAYCPPFNTIPFHWMLPESDKLLCVRGEDIFGCCWSGGFLIEKIDSFHINIRDQQGHSIFLHVAISMKGATNVIVFSDSDKRPTPFRIDNYSEVPITIHQSYVTEDRLRTLVRPKSSVPYAWDEPTLPATITCCAPGFNSGVYNMNAFGESWKLAYENFIYIAFSATFKQNQKTMFTAGECPDNFDCNLVMDVRQGNSIALSEKVAGRRSQLWRMTSRGLLQHEGSFNPKGLATPNITAKTILVLDVSDQTSLEKGYVSLMLRKPDDKRRSTQTWNFTDDGRLCCELKDLFVQCACGKDGLVSGNEVVLGPTHSGSCGHVAQGIPIEQAISRQRLWPGSGMLSLTVMADGPTRVLQVADARQKALICDSSQCSKWVCPKQPRMKKLQLAEHQKIQETKRILDLHICVALKQGIGISVVNTIPEELVYTIFANITAEYTRSNSGQTIDISIASIKVDNQLFDAEVPILLLATANSKDSKQPALHFSAQNVYTETKTAEIFKHLILTIKKLTIKIEEKVMWKLIQLLDWSQFQQELNQSDDNVTDGQREMVCVDDTNNKSFYFGTLKLMLHQVQLSVLTTSQLPYDLQVIKRKLGVTLIKFEGAQVELDPFVRLHTFETYAFLMDSITDHYKEELKGQVSKILGSFDFLGNPIGLMNDVSEGLTGFIKEGNVGGLVKNVTHGLSDSAAKVVSTLSHGLGRVTMDGKHEDTRKQMWKECGRSSSDHLVAGLKGLGYGVVGGMTSILTQTYEGAITDGFQGFFCGFGKGIVGTVAKPTVGVLDFAAGAARAIRETSRSQHHSLPLVTRLPRVCNGPGRLLPHYSTSQSYGQQQLHIVNGKDYTELFIAYEQIRSGSEAVSAIISSQRVFFLSMDNPVTNNIILCIDHSCLHHCSSLLIEEDGKCYSYLELTVVSSHCSTSIATEDTAQKRPKVRCDSDSIAQKVAEQIHYAKRLYEEIANTLPLQVEHNLDI